MMTQEKLISLIEEAFRDVELGEGIGLWEAQGMDLYEDVDALKQYRARDERYDWHNVEPDVLNECETSLHFFNADGMRFHLPAFLLAEVNGQGEHGLLFHITNVSQHGRGRFSTLNAGQKKAVIAFLKWCLTQEEYKELHKRIKVALKEVWKNTKPK